MAIESDMNQGGSQQPISHMSTVDTRSALSPFFMAGTSKILEITTSTSFLLAGHEDPKDVEEFMKSWILISNLYNIMLMLVKIAILLEWTHLFVPRYTRDTFFWISHSMIGICCCLYTTIIIVTNEACRPREKLWRGGIPGTCIDINSFNVAVAVLILAFDIIMLLLPHRVIWRLSLSTRQKLGVSAVFSAGLIMLHHSDDLIYIYSRQMIWGLAETTTTIIVFSVPSIPIAFRSPSPIARAWRLMRSKIAVLLRSRNDTSTKIQDASKPKIPLKGNSHRESPWMDVGSDVHLARLAPVRTKTRIAGVQPQEESNRHDGGILRTTEIDIISTSENRWSEVRSLKQYEHQHPWLDSESE
ncbi:hypothetical protein M426DRAFT_16846 [Hypoxylon sp. CI-4A]|nr:hypothetical protein M426DRAFT_16846 [Hypoxylon sp. CI-4A]